MILVTVGSTHFDSLIKEIDTIAPSLKQKVVCQIGLGKYIPTNCEHFRFNDEFESLLIKSELVVTHGGATVLQCLSLDKKFIAISNTSLADDHQTTFLRVLENHVDIPWSSSISNLKTLISNIEGFSFNMSMSMKKNISDYLLQSIDF